MFTLPSDWENVGIHLPSVSCQALKILFDSNGSPSADIRILPAAWSVKRPSPKDSPAGIAVRLILSTTAIHHRAVPEILLLIFDKITDNSCFVMGRIQGFLDGLPVLKIIKD